MLEGVLKCPLWFLLRSEVTNALNFILAAATAMIAKKQPFYTSEELNFKNH